MAWRINNHIGVMVRQVHITFLEHKKEVSANRSKEFNLPPVPTTKNKIQQCVRPEKLKKQEIQWKAWHFTACNTALNYCTLLETWICSRAHIALAALLATRTVLGLREIKSARFECPSINLRSRDQVKAQTQQYNELLLNLTSHNWYK